MKKITTIVLSGTVALFLNACGGGGGDSLAVLPDTTPDTTPTTTPAPAPFTSGNGLWSGTQTIDGEEYDIQAICYNNKIEGYSVGAHAMFAGTYTMHGDKMESNYHAYDDQGYYITTGTLDGTVSEENTLVANFSNNISQEGSINTTFDKQYYISSSLEKIEGHYVTSTQDFTVSSGKIEGTTNDCDIVGDIFIPDPLVNVYIVEYTLSNCSYSGTYNGLGTITTDASGTFIQAGMNNAERMDLFIFKIK